MTRCRFQIITTIIMSAASTLIDHEVRVYKCDLSLAMHTGVFGLINHHQLLAVTPPGACTRALNSCVSAHAHYVNARMYARLRNSCVIQQLS